MSKIVEGLYYTNTHEWVKFEDGFAYIGITDYAQESLGEIVFVELPEEESTIDAGEELGAIESAYENWIVKVDMEDESQLNKLLSATEYKEICE
jgi:glycine cleavage system H protein